MTVAEMTDVDRCAFSLRCMRKSTCSDTISIAITIANLCARAAGRVRFSRPEKPADVSCVRPLTPASNGNGTRHRLGMVKSWYLQVMVLGGLVRTRCR